jgi:hypothetical protein
MGAILTRTNKGSVIEPDRFFPGFRYLKPETKRPADDAAGLKVPILPEIGIGAGCRVKSQQKNGFGN